MSRNKKLGYVLQLRSGATDPWSFVEVDLCVKLTAVSDKKGCWAITCYAVQMLTEKGNDGVLKFRSRDIPAIVAKSRYVFHTFVPIKNHQKHYELKATLQATGLIDDAVRAYMEKYTITTGSISVFVDTWAEAVDTYKRHRGIEIEGVNQNGYE